MIDHRQAYLDFCGKIDLLLAQLNSRKLCNCQASRKVMAQLQTIADYIKEDLRVLTELNIEKTAEALSISPDNPTVLHLLETAAICFETKLTTAYAKFLLA